MKPLVVLGSVPIEDSADEWRRAGDASGNRDITVVRPAGCVHLPTLEDRADLAASASSTHFMSEWLEHRLDAG
jgi:hypothetical protein